MEKEHRASISKDAQAEEPQAVLTPPDEAEDGGKVAGVTSHCPFVTIFVSAGKVERAAPTFWNCSGLELPVPPGP